MRKIIPTLLILLIVMLLPACQPEERIKRRVAILFSYDENQEKEELEQLCKRWENENLDIELKVFYANYSLDEPTPGDSVRIKPFLDSLKLWTPDLLMVKDDEALNALLYSESPLIQTFPVLYCSVRIPDWKQLDKYNNIRGFWENPNYSVNIKLMESLTGGGRIHLDYQTDPEGERTYKLEKETFNKIHFPFTEEYIHDPNQALRDSIPEETHLCFFPFGEMRGSSLLQYYHKLSEKPHALLLDHTTLKQVQLGKSYSGLVFTIVSDMFLRCDQCLGGYFAPRESIWKEWGDMASAILKGEMLPLNTTLEHKRQFVFSYRILKRWGIDFNKLPEDAVIVGQPVLERHQHAIILTFLILFVLLCALFCGVHIYRRNYKKTMDFLNEVHHSHRHLLQHFGGKDNVLFNMVGEKIYFDRSFLDQLNCTEEYILAEDFEKYAHPDDRVALRKERVRMFHEMNVTYNFQADFDGKGYRHYQIRCGVLRDSRHKTLVAGIILNTEEEYIHKTNLKRTAELAKESLEKTSFFDSITHEIRTPLNAITGFTDFLISEESQYISEEDRKIFMKEIATNNEKLTNIIEDLLELSRIDSGKVELQQERIDLNEMVTFCYQENQSRICPELKFFTTLTDHPLWVEADRNRLASVIGKLIINANKFTTAGHIRLCTALNSDTREASIIVEDTGCGIEDEKLAIIMHRFYKVETMSPGTGLGLPICQAIVKRMNGRITVESEYGKGSKFTVSLPLYPVTPA